jgi:hypothetical protein
LVDGPDGRPESGFEAVRFATAVNGACRTLDYAEVSDFEKHGTKRRTKTARQNNCLTRRAESARTQTSFSPKTFNQGVNHVRDTKVAGARLASFWRQRTLKV